MAQSSKKTSVKKSKTKSTKSTPKSSKTSPSGKGPAASPARKSKPKANTRLTRLASAKLASLRKIISSGDFDSRAASDLDYAIFMSVDKDLGSNYERLRDLPPLRAGYWAAWWLEGEVNNGGFHQFFLNKGPVPAAVALEYYTEHGPKDVAKLLSSAIKKLTTGRLPADYNAMQEVLNPDDPKEDERLLRDMDKVTDKFFDRTGPDLQETRLKFALAHPEEFFS